MSSRQAIVSRVIRLEYLTIACNSMEALGAIISGLVAGGIRLLGFGLDSVIEVSCGALLVWRLHGDLRETCAHAARLAVPVVGIGVLVLAACVPYDALYA